MTIILDRIHKAVSVPKQTYVYPFGCSKTSGFGADYLAFIRGLINCLDRGIGFRLTKITSPHGFTIKNGYTDYFRPFCEYVTGRFHETINRNPLPYQRVFPFVKPLARSLLRFTSVPKADYFAFDMAGDYGLGESCFFSKGITYLAKRKQLMRALWVYNDQTTNQVESFKFSISLPQNYIAMCIRRGDKRTEHSYVNLERYYEVISGLNTRYPTIFLATDDYSIVKQTIELFSEYDIITLSENTDKGYVHSEFRNLPARERRYRTVRFLAQLDIMRSAEIFIGSQTTNVTELTYAYNGGEKVLLVD